jgi:hypothetical protein
LISFVLVVFRCMLSRILCRGREEGRAVVQLSHFFVTRARQKKTRKLIWSDPQKAKV